MFRQAIIDDYNEEIDSIPTNDKLMETLSFSPEFEIRMNKLFAKERRRELFTKVLFYSKQIAAMFILTFAVVFSLLLINPEVRAAVKSIVIEWRDKFTSIIFQSNKSSNMSDEKEWQFEYLPFGYQEYKIDKFGLITNIEYVNGQDQFIYFSYQPDGVNSSISIDNENHEIESTMINGTSGYIAKATDDYENGIIWTMNGYTFSLWSQLQVEELIKIVESIRVK